MLGKEEGDDNNNNGDDSRSLSSKDGPKRTHKKLTKKNDNDSGNLSNENKLARESAIVIGPGNNNADAITPVEGENLYKRLPEEFLLDRGCCPPETRVFIYANPAVFSQWSGIGLLAFLNQVLKLWPEIASSVPPYVNTLAVVAGGVGFGIGAHSLYHYPEDEQTHPFKRAWFAAIKGYGMVFPFL